MCGPCDGQGHLPPPCPESEQWTIRPEITVRRDNSKNWSLYLPDGDGCSIPASVFDRIFQREGCAEPDCDHLICPKCEGTGVQEFIGGRHYE